MSKIYFCIIGGQGGPFNVNLKAVIERNAITLEPWLWAEIDGSLHYF